MDAGNNERYMVIYFKIPCYTLIYIIQNTSIVSCGPLATAEYIEIERITCDVTIYKIYDAIYTYCKQQSYHFGNSSN